jgi:hypothetical protein
MIRFQTDIVFQIWIYVNTPLPDKTAGHCGGSDSSTVYSMQPNQSFSKIMPSFAAVSYVFVEFILCSIWPKMWKSYYMQLQNVKCTEFFAVVTFPLRFSGTAIAYAPISEL